MLALAWISYRSFKFDDPSYTDSAEIAFYCGAATRFNAVVKSGNLWGSQNYGTAAELKEQVKARWTAFERDIVVEDTSEDERMHLREAFESGGFFILLSTMCMADDGDEKLFNRIADLRSELTEIPIKTK